ncbi:unnamed protein product [Rotaria sordida]|uniref:EF-hand domain-containing protein n=1 Tax=Rotaria sordida TaxID=392033 RepID=A0A819YND3_9BILA|nr:unnamed protein product [Rotaria sordida]CAF4156222.1 unnamed protein product [Rotaria sordida]
MTAPQISNDEYLQREFDKMDKELKQAFNEVDTNKDGLISPQEARKGIILAGERIPGRSFGHIVQMFDDNHDGQMSLEEFLNNVQKLIHK